MNTANWPPLFHEVVNAYRALRRNGHDRASALCELKKRFTDELNDTEDGPIVILATAYAMSTKHELIQNLQKQAMDAAAQLRSVRSEGSIASFALAVQTMISRPESIGSEAHYPQKRQYDPGWKIGDVFSHRLSTPNARRLSIDGSIVLLRKIGSYQDAEGNLKQIVNISLCAADRIPRDSEELNTLGLLPMMEGNGGYQYWGQLNLSSKRKEKAFDLRKIGNFPIISTPPDSADHDPYLARPLFGTVVKGSSFPASLAVPDYPSFEDDICLCYRMFGVRRY